LAARRHDPRVNEIILAIECEPSTARPTATQHPPTFPLP